MSAIKVILSAVACCALLGCQQRDPDWVSAPLTHRCNAEQAKQVDYETTTCMKTGGWSGFTGQYCFGSALIRNCPSIATGREAQP